MCDLYRVTIITDDGVKSIHKIEAKNKEEANKKARQISLLRDDDVILSIDVKKTGYIHRAINNNRKEPKMAGKCFTISIKDLKVTAGNEPNAGMLVDSPSALGKILPLSKLNALAVEYIGEKFEKGTKKGDACNQLFEAITFKVCGDEEFEEETPVEEEKPKKKAATKKTAVKKTAKKETTKKEGRKSREHIFIAPGASVNPEKVELNGKKLAKQGVQLLTILFKGKKKGTRVALLKDEILALLADGGYECGGNVWNNFSWYKNRVLKPLGFAE